MPFFAFDPHAACLTMCGVAIGPSGPLTALEYAANKYGLVVEFFVARLVFLTASASIVYAGYRMFLL